MCLQTYAEVHELIYKNIYQSVGVGLGAGKKCVLITDL